MIPTCRRAQVLVQTMKRAPGLIEVSRRDFCAFACLGAAGATLAACFDSGKGAVQTGGLDGTGDGNGTVDAPTGGGGGGGGSGSNVQGHPDGGMGSTDGGVAATCSGTYTDVGATSSYTLNTPKYVSAIKMF